MSKTIIIFAETGRTLNQILKRLATQDVRSVIICADHEIAGKSIQPFNIETRFLTDFIPEGLDKAVLNCIEGFIRKLFDKNPALREELNRDGLKISETISYPLGTLAQHWFRAALTMKHMLESIAADRVVTDAHWFQIASLAEINGVECLEDNLLPDWLGFSKAVYLVLSRLAWILAGIFQRLAVPVLFGWFLNQRLLKGFRPEGVYLIGSKYHNRACYAVWQRLLARGADCLELFPFAPSLLRSSRSSERRWGIVEGLARPSDLVRLIPRYVRIAATYLKVKIPEPIANRDMKGDTFLRAFDRFFLLNVAVAILFGDIGREMRSNNRLWSIIFSLPNSWANAAMSLALKDSPSKIVSITHGMVLDPLAYRSRNSLKVTWSSFDSRLLSEYSRDDRYLSLGNTGNGLGQPDSPEEETFFVQEKDLVWIRDRKNGGVADQPAKRFVGIFPSSDIQGSNLFNLLDTSLQYFGKEKEKHQFDAVLVKIHPRSSLKEYEGLLERYIRNRNGLPLICISKTAPLGVILKHCVFAVCSMSSIMLDFLRHGVPFAVYRRGPYHDQTFINQFPDWMKFKTIEDLDKISADDLHSFAEVSRKLTNAYWDAERNDIDNLEELVDIILSQHD